MVGLLRGLSFASACMSINTVQVPVYFTVTFATTPPLHFISEAWLIHLLPISWPT